ncbi:MAG: penicillin-binding transpeptidase domain-containing protein [Clostridium perfringens]|nr:penicillin-binding transpeptidase domain-containing protein [Clostridium perfringens]
MNRKNNKYNKEIKKVMAVFMILLLLLITYIVYFGVFQTYKISKMSSNTANIARENRIIRGNIYDSEGNTLSYSQYKNVLNQEIKYPYGNVFANVVGYYSPIYGSIGLESYYNKELTTYEYSDGFNVIKLFNERNNVKKGDNVYTTLNAKIQEIAYNELSKYKAGALVAINPKTGAILASVSYPSFNPNDLAESMKNYNRNDESIFFDRATQGLYAPGSTFKVITLASGLENISGLGDRTFNDPGYIKLGDYILPDENYINYGEISLNKALSVSSNVVFGGIIAIELGNSKLKATAEYFGFNENIPTIGFNLAQSIFPTFPDDEIGNIAQTGIGQSEDLATPTEMALVAATIANNGVMMRPYLVSKIENSAGGVIDETTIIPYKTVVSKEIANRITQAMEYVTQQRVDNIWPYFKELGDVASKTGTAETSNGTTNSWWIGFTEDIAVSVIVVEGGSDDTVSAHIAAAVIKVYENELSNNR